MRAPGLNPLILHMVRWPATGKARGAKGMCAAGLGSVRRVGGSPARRTAKRTLGETYGKVFDYSEISGWRAPGADRMHVRPCRSAITSAKGNADESDPTSPTADGRHPASDSQRPAAAERLHEWQPAQPSFAVACVVSGACAYRRRTRRISFAMPYAISWQSALELKSAALARTSARSLSLQLISLLVLRAGSRVVPSGDHSS